MLYALPWVEGEDRFAGDSLVYFDQSMIEVEEGHADDFVWLDRHWHEVNDDDPEWEEPLTILGFVVFDDKAKELADLLGDDAGDSDSACYAYNQSVKRLLAKLGKEVTRPA